jgi:hypothetical protein
LLGKTAFLSCSDVEAHSVALQLGFTHRGS